MSGPRKGKVTTKDSVGLKLRIPKVIHQALVEQAEKNLRSLNSEIIYRLMESLL